MLKRLKRIFNFKRHLRIVKKRIKSRTPIFFKRLIRFCVGVTVFIGAGWAAANGLGWEIPELFANIMGYLMFLCSGAAAVAKMTTDDPDLSKEA